MRALNGCFILIVLTLAAYSAEARVPDDRILTAPNRIWLRDMVNPASTVGKTLPFLSYVSFHDGLLKDHYASFFPVVLPAGCETALDCPDAKSGGEIYGARYELTTTGVLLSEITRSDLIFDQAKSQDILNIESFSGGEADISLSFDSQALYRTQNGNTARYLPTTPETIDALFGLARMMYFPIIEHGAGRIRGDTAPECEAKRALDQERHPLVA